MTNEVAKKTMERIDREQAKLDAQYAKRDKLTATYNKNLTEINESIKEQEALLANLREQEKSEKLQAISAELLAKGITVDDLLAATMNNDLYSIQEKIERMGTTNTEAVAAEPVTTETDSANDTANVGDEGDEDADNSQDEIADNDEVGYGR